MRFFPSIPSAPPGTGGFQFVAPPTVRGTAELIEGRTQLEGAYQRLGIQITPGSRVWCAMRLATTLHNVSQFADLVAELRKPGALVLLRDLLQLSLIAKHLLQDGRDPELAAKARVLLRDRSDPKGSGQNTPGRDAQFELYVAASCTRAGFIASLVPTSESRTPDVQIEVEGETLRIEARRPKQESKLMKCARDAGTKFNDMSTRGVLAVDMSEVMRAPLNLSRTPTALQPVEMSARLAAKVQELARRLEGRREPQGLLCVLGYWLNTTQATDSPIPSAPEGWHACMIGPVTEPSMKALRALSWGLGTRGVREEMNPPGVSLDGDS